MIALNKPMMVVAETAKKTNPINKLIISLQSMDYILKIDNIKVLVSGNDFYSFLLGY